MFGSGFGFGFPRADFSARTTIGDPFMAGLSDFLNQGGLQYIEAGYNFPGFLPYVCEPRFCNSLFSPAYANMGPSDALLGLSIGMTAVMGGLAIANMFGAFDGFNDIFGPGWGGQPVDDPYAGYQGPFEDGFSDEATSAGSPRRGGGASPASGAEALRTIDEIRREDEARTTRERDSSDTPAAPVTAAPADTAMTYREWVRDPKVKSFVRLLNGDRDLDSSGNGFANVGRGRGKKLVLRPKQQKRGESDADYAVRWTGEMRGFFGRTLTGGKTGEAVFMERLKALPDETTLILGPSGVEKTVKDLKAMSFADIFNLLMGEDWTRRPVIPPIPGPGAEARPAAAPSAPAPAATRPATAAVPDIPRDSFLGRLERTRRLEGMRFTRSAEIQPHIRGARRDHIFVVLPDSATPETVDAEIARYTSHGNKEDAWVYTEFVEGAGRYKVLFEVGVAEEAGKVRPDDHIEALFLALAAIDKRPDGEVVQLVEYHQHPYTAEAVGSPIPVHMPVSVEDIESYRDALTWKSMTRLRDKVTFHVVCATGVYSFDVRDSSAPSKHPEYNHELPHVYAQTVGTAYGMKSASFRYFDPGLEGLITDYTQFRSEFGTASRFDGWLVEVKKHFASLRSVGWDGFEKASARLDQSDRHRIADYARRELIPRLDENKDRILALRRRLVQARHKAGDDSPYSPVLDKMLAYVRGSLIDVDRRLAAVEWARGVEGPVA